MAAKGDKFFDKNPLIAAIITKGNAKTLNTILEKAADMK